MSCGMLNGQQARYSILNGQLNIRLNGKPVCCLTWNGRLNDKLRGKPACCLTWNKRLKVKLKETVFSKDDEKSVINGTQDQSDDTTAVDRNSQQVVKSQIDLTSVDTVGSLPSGSDVNGTVNLRNLQIQTLTVEKRKSEVEIEKLQQETKKLNTEINKLEEEKDLYKIQKDYFKLKLKKLHEEMNEQ